MYTLYLKEHKDTGLKYLGYTKRENVHSYPGSGVYWRKHLSKHGWNYTTDILLETESEEELKNVGIYYSELWSICDSREFANLKTEEGVSGSSYGIETRKKMSDSAKKRGAPVTAWTSEQVSEMNKKSWQDPDTRKKRSEGISKALKGKTRGPQSEECKLKKSIALKGRKINLGAKYQMKTKICPHCGTEGKGGNMSRYHFDNCKTITKDLSP